MVKIILSGCLGRMGKSISENAMNFSNVKIVAGIDRMEDSSSKYPIFKDIKDCNIEADVVLDFSKSDAIDSLLNYCTNKDLPLVLCTTGYNEDQLKKIDESSKLIPMFHSANMSIGINLINNILKDISNMLYENYDIEIVEKHHNQKLDAPSGTALLLANTIKDSIKENTTFNKGRNGYAKRDHNEIGIHAVRGGSIVGEHDIIFAGAGEIIELKHTALSREVFAIGALKACEYMSGREKGMYSMDNVIKNNI